MFDNYDLRFYSIYQNLIKHNCFRKLL